MIITIITTNATATITTIFIAFTSIIIVVGSLILCLVCRYAIKKCVASNNGNRRNGREIQVTKSGGIIELGTRQFSIRTPTANPSHAVGLIQQRD